MQCLSTGSQSIQELDNFLNGKRCFAFYLYREVLMLTADVKVVQRQFEMSRHGGWDEGSFK